MNKLSRGKFKSDLIYSVIDISISFLLALCVYFILRIRVDSGQDNASKYMPQMIYDGGSHAYSLSQGFGFSALLYSWLSIILGLIISTSYFNRKFKIRRKLENTHRSISIALFLMIVLHAVLLVWSGMGDTFKTVFLPYFYSDISGRFAVSLGIFSFYGLLIFGFSFYFRDKLKPIYWRLAHKIFMPIVYILGLWHTFIYGSDLVAGEFIWFLIFIIQLPIVLLMLNIYLIRIRSLKI